MAKVIFGSLRESNQDWSYVLVNPKRIYSTSRLDELIPILGELESHAQSGLWVALMLSYEAAPAFDSHLKTHSIDSGFPLLWAAVFENPGSKSDIAAGTYVNGPWEPQTSAEAYTASVSEIRELIACGDTYQVNYTFPIVTSFSGDALAWYQNLCDVQRARYCAYLEFDTITILSLSPELFFKREGNRITTKPMKGTNERGRWPAEDDEFARQLSESPKQRAENVMIVDLLRNDLGKISTIGSVNVSEQFHVERYPTLLQMTSTISSDLKPGTTLADIFRALFPCGSITGAPKIRTMEIIKQLEVKPRRVYTGTIGLIKPGGDCTFNVAIRTGVIDHARQTVTFGIGGGITYSSDARQEFEECLLKASFLNQRKEAIQLLESILLEGGNYFLLDEHLARLKASARYFDILFDEQSLRRQLLELQGKLTEGRWKIRLVVSQNGLIEIESQWMESETQKPLLVGLAAEPIDSKDRNHYHKLTSNTERYRKKMVGNPDSQDVILWNERGEITQSSIANIVVRFGNRLVTPPVTSGLLPGTFRASLLEQGTIQEQVVTVEQLRAQKEFFLINSVRKWRVAELLQSSRSVGI